MKPVIGVMPLFDEEKDSIWMVPGYMEGIRRAGGIPLIIPLRCEGEDLGQLNDICAGYLFTGGHDVDPHLYGEEPDELCGRINNARDELEKRVFDMAWEMDKAVFGICRGLQIMNVFLGGTLYQDLPTQYVCARAGNAGMVDHHMCAPYDRACHQVDILPDTPCAGFLAGRRWGSTAITIRESRRWPRGLGQWQRRRTGWLKASMRRIKDSYRRSSGIRSSWGPGTRTPLKYSKGS